MHTKALPYVVLLSLFWGTNAVASRFGVGQFDPFLFILLRLAIATLFFVPTLMWQQGGFPTDRSLLKKAALSGLIGVAIPFPTFIYSLQYQSTGIATLYVTLFPVMVAIGAHFFLPDEKMTRYKFVGVILALCGTLFLAVRGESGLADVGRASPLGFILVTTGLLFETINTMFVRRKMKKTDPMQVTAIRLLTASIVLFFVTFAVGDFSLAAVNTAGYLSLAYAALIGALGGQFMAFYIQNRFSATAFSLTSFLVPVVATVFGALLLDEILTWAMGVGVLFIGSGLYLINYMKAADRTKIAGT